MPPGDEVGEAIAHANIPNSPPLSAVPEHPTDAPPGDPGLVVFDAAGEAHPPGQPSGSYPPAAPSHAPDRHSISIRPPEAGDHVLHAATALGRASVDALSFNFRDHLLPLSLSAADESLGEDAGVYESDRLTSSPHLNGAYSSSSEAGRVGRRVRFAPTEFTPPTAAVKRINLFDGIALTIGMQVGSGIFSSPGVLTLRAGSVGASICVWLFSGFLAWTGAASFAELGAMIPLNGGAQSYLYFSMGALPSYLFSWTAITALKPGGGAIIAIIFGEYIARIVLHFRKHQDLPAASSASGVHAQALAVEELPVWLSKVIAVSLIMLLAAVHCLSSRLGTRLQNLTTTLKLLALAAIPIFAIVQVARGKMPEESRIAFSSVHDLFAGSSRSWGSYALALYSGLWAFDGWDQVCYIAGEMKNVKRDLPRVIHISLSTVLFFFTLTVTSYFLVLPPAAVAKTNTVALDFGRTVLGGVGGVIFASVVAFSCLGALNAGFITTARLITTAASEGYLPGGNFFAAIHPRRRTAIRAILLETALMCIFVLVGDGFSSMVNFYGVCSWGGYFATVLGLLILRIKEPAWERPYKVRAPSLRVAPQLTSIDRHGSQHRFCSAA